MKAITKHRLRAIAVSLLALLSFGLATVFSVLAVSRARMPYNSEGRFFDGLVVHHAEAGFVYGGLALLFWILAGLFGVWAGRTLKRTKAD